LIIAAVSSQLMAHNVNECFIKFTESIQLPG
jgi:hypothetical protein